LPIVDRSTIGLLPNGYEAETMDFASGVSQRVPTAHQITICSTAGHILMVADQSVAPDADDGARSAWLGLTGVCWRPSTCRSLIAALGRRLRHHSRLCRLRHSQRAPEGRSRRLAPLPHPTSPWKLRASAGWLLPDPRWTIVTPLRRGAARSHPTASWLDLDLPPAIGRSCPRHDVCLHGDPRL
jgi:hypothetical protein